MELLAAILSLVGAAAFAVGFLWFIRHILPSYFNYKD